MGYTHYFQQSKAVSDESWDKIKKDTKKIIKDQIKAGIPLESNDSKNKSMVSSSEINFNGVDDDSHETFYITKEKMKDFNFCKTARKPYDLAVTATLLIIEHHAPEHFDIGSDGGIEGFLEAAKLNYELFGYGYSIPKPMQVQSPGENSTHEHYFNSIKINEKLEKELSESKTKKENKRYKV